MPGSAPARLCFASAQLALERNSRTGAVLRSYTYGQGPIGFTTPKQTIGYHTDSLGSIVELSNENGAGAGSYRYGPYGDSLYSGAPATSQSDSNPIRFTGQYLDADSGLYDLRAREYDPTDGRFLETDPAAESSASSLDLSDYLYASDDPTLLTDPSGLYPSFGVDRTLDCKRNGLLCDLIYHTGYRDGDKGRHLRRALDELYGMGIDFSVIEKSIENKGKLSGLRGMGSHNGFYFLNYGGGSYKITPPKGIPWYLGCGWRCMLGFVGSQIYGCNSLLSCEVNNAIFWAPIPAGKGTRLMERSPWLARILRIARQGERVEQDLSYANEARRVEEGAVAVEKGTTEFLSYSSGNFRKNLIRLTGEEPEGCQAHHIFPQKFRELFQRSGINVDDPHYGAWWQQGAHSHASYQYNLDWQDLFTRNPNRDQILQFGREEARRYGIKAAF